MGAPSHRTTTQRITRIAVQKKDRSRASIFLDGEFVAGVSAETLLRAGIRRGDEISPERLETLRRMESLNRAWKVALRYLARRPRTEKEVCIKLTENECTPDEIDSTLTRLRSAGLVNDENLAGSFIRDALRHRPSGPARIRQKMLLRGFDRKLVESSLRSGCPEQTERLAVQTAAEKYLRTRAGRTNDKLLLRKKLTEHLTRRGFGWHIVQMTIKELLAAHTNGRNSQ